MAVPPMPERPQRPAKPLPTRVSDTVLAVLALVSLGLSGWSLATLLHTDAHAPWLVAGLGVGVFDLVALLACMQVYQRRATPHLALGARLVMMGALLASAVVNGAHGYALGGWTVAAVLATAPLAFEVAFELRHRSLTVLIWLLFRREATAALRRDAWARIAPVTAEPVDGATLERVVASAGQVPVSAPTAAPAAAVPAGHEADARPQITSAQVDKADTAPVARPDAEAAVPVGTAPSMRAAVRQLVKAGMTDPHMIMAAVPGMLPGRTVQPASIQREIRKARAEVEQHDRALTGPYL